eukprot:RCo021212
MQQVFCEGLSLCDLPLLVELRVEWGLAVLRTRKEPFQLVKKRIHGARVLVLLNPNLNLVQLVLHRHLLGDPLVLLLPLRQNFILDAAGGLVEVPPNAIQLCGPLLLGQTHQVTQAGGAARLDPLPRRLLPPQALAVPRGHRGFLRPHLLEPGLKRGLLHNLALPQRNLQLALQLCPLLGLLRYLILVAVRNLFPQLQEGVLAGLRVDCHLGDAPQQGSAELPEVPLCRMNRALPLARSGGSACVVNRTREGAVPTTEQGRLPEVGGSNIGFCRLVLGVLQMIAHHVQGAFCLGQLLLQLLSPQLEVLLVSLEVLYLGGQTTEFCLLGAEGSLQPAALGLRILGLLDIRGHLQPKLVTLRLSCLKLLVQTLGGIPERLVGVLLSPGRGQSGFQASLADTKLLGAQRGQPGGLFAMHG